MHILTKTDVDLLVVLCSSTTTCPIPRAQSLSVEVTTTGQMGPVCIRTEATRCFQVHAFTERQRDRQISRLNVYKVAGCLARNTSSSCASVIVFGRFVTVDDSSQGCLSGLYALHQQQKDSLCFRVGLQVAPLCYCRPVPPGDSSTRLRVYRHEDKGTTSAAHPSFGTPW